jgi:hypothetical protein
MMTLKRLALSNHTFADIIDDNLLYADKTKYIYNLLKSEDKSFFLSRPRCFGKSLLLSTLKELFTGDRRRFEGLWIGQSDYAFPRYPVICMSLAVSAPSAAVLESNLSSEMRCSARFDYDLELEKEPPDMCLNHLIRALSDKTGARVAVLICESDAPVTRNFCDLRIAEANAEVIRRFLATLKDVDVADRLAFTLVTGITRYALSSLDSGPNHLVDISLDPMYGGICGFTLDEFEALFADRLEGTLASLVKTGRMSPSDTIEDLAAMIIRWYGGYNWGGETRVLNPYSILNFFHANTFENYWLLYGLSRRLTALVKARTLDCLTPELDSFLSEEVRESDPKRVRAAPVLFHSGYLTVDKVTLKPAAVTTRTNPKADPETATAPVTTETGLVPSYVFRVPNYEVIDSYYHNCLRLILNLESRREIETKVLKLREALLARDGEAVATQFETIFKAFSFSQKPDCEAAFQRILQGVLRAMGFKILTEAPGLKGGPDLLVRLSERQYVLIGLRHHAKKEALTDRERTSALAILARTELRRGVLDRYLTAKAESVLGAGVFEGLIAKADEDGLIGAAKKRRLADEARRLLGKAELETIFANAAEAKLPAEVIAQEIKMTLAVLNLTYKEINQALSKAARGALDDLVTRGGHSALGRVAENITTLGLGIYGHGERVKAVFGPAPGTLGKTPPIPETPDSSEAVTKL